MTTTSATAAITATQAPAVVAAGDPATSGAAAAPAAENWYAGHPDENIRNWAANKGWPDPMAALESGYHLERLIGFEKAGRTLVVPKDDATPEERSAFFQKLGAPAKADGYKLPEELSADPVAQKFRELAHKNGMLPAQFEESLAFVTAEAKAIKEQQQQQRAVQSEQEMGAIRGEWGAAYDKNIELARRAAQGFIPAKDAAERSEILSKIEEAIGTGKMLRMFAKIGEGLGEHPVHSSGDSGGGVMTPGAAKAKIEALKSDREWSTAYINGDAGKRDELNRLIKFAYPEQPQ